jgi:outer membrane lipoprotein-sorting protein
VHQTGLHRNLASLWAVSAFFLVSGCAASRTTAVQPSGAPQPLSTAGKQELVERFDQQARAVTSLNASVTMTLTAGSAYSGVIKQYHEINGFILAAKPSSIRVIGQAPVVGTDIFDMVSDGQTFHIFIPSQHKFIVGPANLTRPSAKPIENLRPQHLSSALLWNPIPDRWPVLMEEAGDQTARYYVLTVVRESDASGSAVADWEIAKKVWFDRTDLHIARIEAYESAGELVSDVSYSGWTRFGNVNYPRQIVVSRPVSDYKLRIEIKKAALNDVLSPDRFVLEQPPGTELVNAAEASGETKAR